MNAFREAQTDAAEYARAKVFYGEGAGNRRKLINAAVDYKMRTWPGYEEAFNAALDRQNMADHAIAARRERRRKDVSTKVDRNVRGLVSGNRRSLTTGVAVVSMVVYAAHQTGYDQKVKTYTKAQYIKARRWVRKQRANIS